MKRRTALQFFGAGGVLTSLPASVRAQTTRSGLPTLKITDVKTILPQVGGDYLVVVKVLTSEPGLYGIGCATHGERPLAVATAVNEYLHLAVLGGRRDGVETIRFDVALELRFGHIGDIVVIEDAAIGGRRHVRDSGPDGRRCVNRDEQHG